MMEKALRASFWKALRQKRARAERLRKGDHAYHFMKRVGGRRDIFAKKALSPAEQAEQERVAAVSETSTPAALSRPTAAPAILLSPLAGTLPPLPGCLPVVLQIAAKNEENANFKAEKAAALKRSNSKAVHETAEGHQVPVFLSLCLVCLPAYLSTCLPAYLSTCLYAHPPTC